MGKSELVILDEPSTGLDPLMQQELQQLRELVRELRPSPLGDAAADEPPPPHY